MMNLSDREKAKLIQKFNLNVPRYTSYPTIPIWHEYQESLYINDLTASSLANDSLAIYIHVPFCNSLCFYCACLTQRAPADSDKLNIYVDNLLHEIELLTSIIGNKQRVTQLHFGGGTPNILTTEQLSKILNKINSSFHVASDSEIAIEIDPRALESENLSVLADLGFNRLSLGIQDLDPNVQAAINRKCSFGRLQNIVAHAKKLKFKSINFDLIYGLPLQTVDSFQHTIKQTIALRPDRIALYSYAHMPHMIKRQQLIDADNLPTPEQKLDIFLQARELFLQNDYCAIGMDHFALKNDELSMARANNKLHRNFMGYTVKNSDHLIGLGPSAISFINGTYAQNAKDLPRYYGAIANNKLAITRGFKLSLDDKIRYWVIKQLVCYGKINIAEFKRLYVFNFDDYFVKEKTMLEKAIQDGLLHRDNNHLELTELGQLFVRNICSIFDCYLQRNCYQGFSKAI